MNYKIKQELEKIEIPKQLHERSKLGVIKAKSEKSKRKVKILAIPFVASIFVVFTAGVGAAHIPSLNSLVAAVSPEIALMLQPVDISSESNGIKMEVVAAIHDNEMAVIYVTLQDTTDNRIDETLDLYHYSLTGAHVFNSQIVDYDDQTNTATLRIQGNGGESLSGRKVNFHIKSFLSDKQTIEIAVDANLSEITSKRPQTVSLDMNNIPGGGGNMYERLKEQGIVQVLKPGETEITFPEIMFMHVSSIGMIDNRLHIQVRWNKENIDDHGYFYFVDDSGENIYPTSITFGVDKAGHTNYGHEYTEYIFDMENIDFESQQLLGHFVSNGKYTTGNWNATFKIQPVQEEMNRDLNMDFGTWSSSKVSISPLGITLYGEGMFNDSNNIEIYAKMADGTLQRFDNTFNYSEDKKITIKYASPLPIEFSRVKSIYVNDTEINVK